MSEPIDRTETLDDPVDETWTGSEGIVRARSEALRAGQASLRRPAGGSAGPPEDQDATGAMPQMPAMATDPTLGRTPSPEGQSRNGVRPAARVLSSRYRLDELIANGGMAAVWRARDEVLARTVAVKLLHDHLAADGDFRERFRREAISAAKLTHPNVVGLYDTGNDNGQVFLVMEFVEGKTLRDVIGDLRGLPPGHAAAIALKVARALAYAHQRGLVHRDVKPANILIGIDGAVKVADFGIAKADQADDLTKTGMVLGTAAYVAPEQILARPIDGQADQYALGCVLYESLSGVQPFKAETAVATAAQRLERLAPELRSVRGDVPEGLADIIARAMSREPGDRFPSVGDFGDALVAYAQGDTEHTAALVMARADPAGRAPEQGGSDNQIAATTGHVRSAVAGPGAVPGPARDAEPTLIAHAPAPAPKPAAPRVGDAGAGDERRPRRGRWLVPLALLLVAVGGGLAAVATGAFAPPSPSLPTVAAPDGPDEPDEPDEPAPEDPSRPIALAVDDLSVFDPSEDGENDEDLGNLVDGDDTTEWRTEGYDFADLSRFKPGVGVLIDLGEPTSVVEVDLAVELPGVAMELRAADQRPQPPDGFEDMDVVASVDQARQRTVLEPEEPLVAQFLLVWVTGDLQPVETPERERFYAAFSELIIRGR